MTIQQMKYFIMTADAGSISEAAKRLYAAQSSVSSAIKEIETYYGITAFIRDTKGVLLTKAGEELLIEFKAIMNRLDYLDEKYTEKHYQHSGCSVATQHHICGFDCFMSVIDHIEKQEYQFGYYEGKTSEVLDWVEHGAADLGIIFFSQKSKGQMMQELRKRNIIFNHISYRKAHAYICHTHPLAAGVSDGKFELCMEELIQYPFITYDRMANANPAYTETIVPYVKTKKVIAVSDRASAYSLLRRCNGFVVGSGYLPGDKQYDDILSIPLQRGTDLEIGWITKSNFILNEQAVKLVELLKQSGTIDNHS